jgi:hypothetical protein
VPDAGRAGDLLEGVDRADRAREKRGVQAQLDEPQLDLGGRDVALEDGVHDQLAELWRAVGVHGFQVAGEFSAWALWGCRHRGLLPPGHLKRAFW